jgi:hypothetical protein
MLRGGGIGVRDAAAHVYRCAWARIESAGFAEGLDGDRILSWRAISYRSIGAAPGVVAARSARRGRRISLEKARKRKCNPKIFDCAALREK